MDLKQQILEIKEKFARAIEDVKNSDDLEQVKIEYLGRKSQFNQILKGLKDLGEEQRKKIGRMANLAKQDFQARLDELKESITGGRRAESRFDYTLPGKRSRLGRTHPIVTTMREISDIFFGMGFGTEVGPEIETDYYNFQSLNMPKDHPARDMQDTFYISGDLVLRTHTTPVQVRTLERAKPPARFIAPGRCYRNEAISVRSHAAFHQIDGFFVDRDVSFADLKGVLVAFARSFFGSDVKLKFRPSFFPFTEPSAEVDISCFLCKGEGCALCKRSGWLEILGCGMIDPVVFDYVGYDPEAFSGYAFGIGIERICLLKYGIDDIRLFFENDIRFLEQF
jgi:phenylalanyl-tRNA synthetase alpha chain